jgi:uncharacterized protein (DUF697 family)
MNKKSLIFSQVKSPQKSNSQEKSEFFCSLIKAALGIGETASNGAYRWIKKTTEDAGHVITSIGNLPLLRNPFVRRLAGVLKLNWLIGISDRVDLSKAQKEVQQLRQKHSDETPSQIAHRIMVQKATYASGIGFASSILPGVATALLAIDLAATTALQTEMVYEIAAAYGLDLQDPARKGEVLAIFGLALGGSNAIKAGLGFIRNVPLAGATIAAGTNATMLYSLGYAACRFYEAKLQETGEEPTTKTLKAIQQESEKYLDVAISQQAIVDRILVHMLLASYPQKTRKDILLELDALQIATESKKTIAANIQSPQPLDDLLAQLNRDFAIPLLAQCRRIAQSSGEISPEEVRVLKAIAQKFNLDFGSI